MIILCTIPSFRKWDRCSLPPSGQSMFCFFFDSVFVLIRTGFLIWLRGFNLMRMNMYTFSTWCRFMNLTFDLFWHTAYFPSKIYYVAACARLCVISLDILVNLPENNWNLCFGRCIERNACSQYTYCSQQMWFLLILFRISVFLFFFFFFFLINFFFSVCL